MRATLVEIAGDRATVRLTPGRIARWFGARETLAELHVREVAVDVKQGPRLRLVQ